MAALVTLTVSSFVTIPGGMVTLTVSVASTGGALPTAVQCTFSYGANITLTGATIGGAGTSASKTLSRSGDLCIVSGVNVNVIPDGFLLVPTFTVVASPTSGTIPITLINVIASDASANTIPTAVVAGNVLIPPSLTFVIGSPAVGVSYSSPLLASQGTPPYLFSMFSGTLPPGLALNPTTGVISGIPTLGGSYPFIARVTDANGLTANTPILMPVSGGVFPANPTLSCPIGGNAATDGVPYSHSLVAGSGTPPYTFSISAGALPTGLSLNASTGLISGTPTIAGPFSYTARVVDSIGNSASAPCGITVSSGAPSALALACPLTGTATVGIAYSGSLIASNGTAPYSYSIVSGSIPPGLSLNSATGAITGTPTTNGIFNYTANVTDAAADTAPANCSFTVTGASPPGPPAMCEIVPVPGYTPPLLLLNEPVEQVGT
jgi:hypothetical protein